MFDDEFKNVVATEITCENFPETIKIAKINLYWLYAIADIMISSEPYEIEYFGKPVFYDNNRKEIKLDKFILPENQNLYDGSAENSGVITGAIKDLINQELYELKDNDHAEYIENTADIFRVGSSSPLDTPELVVFSTIYAIHNYIKNSTVELKSVFSKLEDVCTAREINNTFFITQIYVNASHAYETMKVNIPKYTGKSDIDVDDYINTLCSDMVTALNAWREVIRRYDSFKYDVIEKLKKSYEK